MRDFVYSEEEVLAGKNELSKLESDKKKQFVSFLLSCAVLTILTFIILIINNVSNNSNTE